MGTNDQQVRRKYRFIGLRVGSVLGLFFGLFVGAQSELEKFDLLVNMGYSAIFFAVIFGIGGLFFWNCPTGSSNIGDSYGDFGGDD